ncbi:hypothetical protein V8G54_029777 [Vigna mungo]|uniref:PGG domain-containing protein n=1 Tax=Vigna mungo TaxID=3915 RepID=A0AAQ3MV55_VIGMU
MAMFRSCDVDHQLCHIHGREGTLPLRINVMKALFSAASLTVQSKTTKGETPSYCFAVGTAKGLKMERVVLNDKDNQTNTVLHLAVSRKQYQIVDMLLVKDDVAKEVMVCEASDLEIYKSLVKTGAKSGKEIENENEAGRIGQPLEVEIVHGVHVPPRNCTDEESNVPKTTEEFEELLFTYKPNRDSINDVRNILLTVAALMITATYQAVLSLPGGVWQEDTDQYSAGKSIVATKSRGTFLLFILGNSIGYCTSFHMIIWLTSYFPMCNMAMYSVWLRRTISY